MPLYKNISGYKIKINNRYLYPNQTIKLSSQQYNKYKNKQDLKLIEHIVNKPIIKRPTPKIIEKEISDNHIYSKHDITAQIDLTELISMLGNINTTLNEMRSDMSNMTLQSNIISNHTEPIKEEIKEKQIIQPTQIFDSDIENDLLSNLLENSIR